MLRPMLFVVMTAMLAGCDAHVYRQSGTPVPGYGNAVRQNAAVMIVDPQPAGAANTVIDMDGRRALQAIERYRTGTEFQPVELSTTDLPVFFGDGSGGSEGGDGGGMPPTQ